MPKMEKVFQYTLPETNSKSSENRPLETEIPVGNQHFQVRTVSFREGSETPEHSIFLN